MSKTHNKKRNTILVYEFLIRTMSRALMEDDKTRQAKALKIIRRHFKPNSELYKEFRLAHAMYQTTVTTPNVAGSIMSEAKNAVRTLDEKKLEREKDLLIREINHSLGQDIYNEQVVDYTILASIQTLFNEWKSTSVDLGRLAEFEDKISTWLLTEKSTPDITLDNLDHGTTRLVSNIMTKKLNEKYDKELNRTQKEIVRIYTLDDGSSDSIKTCLSGLRNRLYEQLKTLTDDKHVEVKKMLIEEQLDVINDETITRFMMYAKLEDEIGVEGKNHE